MRTCRICDTHIVPTGKRGRIPTVCSDACRRARDRLAPGYVQRLQHGPVPPRERWSTPTTHRCLITDCAEVFEYYGVGKPQQYCKPHTAQRIAAARRGSSRDSLTKVCEDTDCERPVRARMLCNMHYKRVLRAEGRTNDAWNDRRRDNHHARRARLNGARNGDRALLSDIIKRDGTTCKWCGADVDLDLAWPDRMSKSIDHALPVSRGGAHTLENTQIMHLSCNSSKGNRIV